MAQPSVSAEAFLQMGRDILAQQPFSGLLGAEQTALSPGVVELQLPMRDELRQQHGFAQIGRAHV